VATNDESRRSETLAKAFLMRDKSGRAGEAAEHQAINQSRRQREMTKLNKHQIVGTLLPYVHRGYLSLKQPKIRKSTRVFF